MKLPIRTAPDAGPTRRNRGGTLTILGLGVLVGSLVMGGVSIASAGTGAGTGPAGPAGPATPAAPRQVIIVPGTSGQNLVKVDPNGNTFKVDPANNTVKVDPNGNTFKVDPANNTFKVDPANNTVKVDPANNTVKVDPTANPFKVDPANNGVTIADQTQVLFPLQQVALTQGQFTTVVDVPTANYKTVRVLLSSGSCTDVNTSIDSKFSTGGNALTDNFHVQGNLTNGNFSKTYDTIGTGMVIFMTSTTNCSLFVGVFGRSN
jgi:hypothetical protein